MITAYAQGAEPVSYTAYSPTAADYIWTSSDVAVFTVVNGVVTGLTPGQATLTATHKEIGNSATLFIDVPSLLSLPVTPTTQDIQRLNGNVPDRCR